MKRSKQELVGYSLISAGVLSFMASIVGLYKDTSDITSTHVVDSAADSKLLNIYSQDERYNWQLKSGESVAIAGLNEDTLDFELPDRQVQDLAAALTLMTAGLGIAFIGLRVIENEDTNISV